MLQIHVHIEGTVKLHTWWWLYVVCLIL